MSLAGAIAIGFVALICSCDAAPSHRAGDEDIGAILWELQNRSRGRLLDEDQIHDLSAEQQDALNRHLDRLAAHVDSGGFANVAYEFLRCTAPRTLLDISPSAKARYLARRLTQDQFHNAWGVPGEALTESTPLARDVIDLGSVGIAYVRDALLDDRMVHIEGSALATMIESRGYRVSDYAEWLLMSILDEPYSYGENEEERGRRKIALYDRLRCGGRDR